MTALVFAGPTLAGEETALAPTITMLPPAGQGDIHRAVEKFRPRSIGLADGYFEGVPSVWHKEILWAMAEGVAVYGSASMGALRAAELEAFGMVGVGAIFEAYRDGVLEADDEVALLHGPAEAGYVALTEPLVNVRASCAAAAKAGLLARLEGDAIVAQAKALFYKERTWPEILARLPAAGIAPGPLAAFRAWLATGAVDQKRLDAVAMIERMAADLAEGVRPPHRGNFTPTLLWEIARSGWRRDAATPDALPEGHWQDVLDEVRLVPGHYRELKARAVSRMLALEGRGGPPKAASREVRRAVLRRHREAHRLASGAELDRWLSRQQLDRADYDRLIDEEAAADPAHMPETPELRRHMVALLKLDGRFASHARRAAAKRSGEAAREMRAARGPGPVPASLVDWYFRTLGQAIPDDLDLFVQGLGLESRERFHGLLRAEYLYSPRARQGSPDRAADGGALE
jgi:hypothetical protein